MNVLKTILEILNPANVSSLRAKIGNYAMAAIAAIAVVYQLLAQFGIELPGIGCPPVGEQPTIDAQ